MGERQRGPAEAPNLGTPSEPRPAASVVLLRRGGKHGDRALEVLLLKRSRGGEVHARRLGLPRRRRRPRRRRGRGGPPRLRGARALRGGGDRAAGRGGAGPVLALDHAGGDLDPLRRLVLPRPRPRPHPAASRTGSRPSRPPGSAAPRRWRRRRPARSCSPSRRSASCGRCSPFRTSDEALAAHRGRAVEPILPKVIGTREDHRVVLPGDPDYPGLWRAAAGRPDEGPRRHVGDDTAAAPTAHPRRPRRRGGCPPAPI